MSIPPPEHLEKARAAVAAAKERLLSASSAAQTAEALLASRATRADLESALSAALLAFGAAVFDALDAGRVRLEDGSSRTVVVPSPSGNAGLSSTAANVSGPVLSAGSTSVAPDERSVGPRIATPGAEGSAIAKSADAEERPSTPIEVTPEILDRLRSAVAPKLTAKGSAVARTLTDVEVTISKEAVSILGCTGMNYQDSSMRFAELDRVERAVTELSRWGNLPEHLNHALTSWLAARARALQDALLKASDTLQERRTNALFHAMKTHSNVTRPGVVHGLARVHMPNGESWAADALGYEQTVRGLIGTAPPAEPTEAAAKLHDDELRRLAEDVREGLSGTALVRKLRALVAGGVPPTDPRLVRTAVTVIADLEGIGALNRLRRAAVRLAEEEAEQETETAARELVRADWPHWSATREKVAVIVGGEPRVERIQRLQDVFGFKELTWVDGAAASGKQVDSLVRRMRNGSVDIVLVLRAFSSHKLSDKVFAADSPHCLRILADTYGVLQVRLGFERFLARAPEAEAA